MTIYIIVLFNPTETFLSISKEMFEVNLSPLLLFLCMFVTDLARFRYNMYHFMFFSCVIFDLKFCKLLF